MNEKTIDNFDLNSLDLLFNRASTAYCIECNNIIDASSKKKHTFINCPSCNKDVFIIEYPKIREDWYQYFRLTNWSKPFSEIKLFHFTDKANLVNIKKHGGLFSWKFLSDNKILVPRPSSNEKSRNDDYARGLHDYIRLSFNPKPPMYYQALEEGRIIDPQIIEFDPIVLLFEGNLFSDRNANDKNCNIGSRIEDLCKIRFEYANTGKFRNETEKDYVQAEVLIKPSLPLLFMKNQNR